MARFRICMIIALAAALIFFVGAKLYSRFYVDSLAPVITCDGDTVEAGVHDGDDALLAGVRAYDETDGDLTDDVMVAGISRLISSDTAKITYLVFDNSNNMGSLTRYVRYTDYERPHFELKEPLVFNEGESISLAGKLHAYDVLDGDITGSVTVSTLDLSTGTEGIYSITVQVTNSLGDTARVSLPVIIRASGSAVPQVMLKSYLIYLNTGEAFDASDWTLSVFDQQNRGASSADIVWDGTVDTMTAGTYRVTYTYTSPNGRIGTAVLVAVVE